MKDLDYKIRAAMKDSRVDPPEDSLFEDHQEETLREQIFESFRGHSRWMTIMVWIESFIFFALAVFAAVRFFEVESTRDLIFYATLFLICMGIQIAMKIWYWMLLNKNSVTREIKRLELQVAMLARRLPGSE